MGGHLCVFVLLSVLMPGSAGRSHFRVASLSPFNFGNVTLLATRSVSGLVNVTGNLFVEGGDLQVLRGGVLHVSGTLALGRGRKLRTDAGGTFDCQVLDCGEGEIALGWAAEGEYRVGVFGRKAGPCRVSDMSTPLWSFHFNFSDSFLNVRIERSWAVFGFIAIPFAFPVVLVVLLVIVLEIRKRHRKKSELDAYEARLLVTLENGRDIEVKTDTVAGFYEAKDFDVDLNEVEFHAGMGRAAQWW